MYISQPTLDDLLHEVFQQVISTGVDVTESKGGRRTRGEIKELMGVLLRLENPRARLSRTETKGMVFSALGEFLWYMAGSNDLEFIKYYIDGYKNETDDGKTVYGAYGPRLFGRSGYLHDQITNVVGLLSRNKLSKRAVIQLYGSADIADEHAEIPCTCTLQFLIRDDRLFMFTNMRSNDAFKGLPHDIFAFTMLQEMIARILDVELGEYYHSVASLHIYLKKTKKKQKPDIELAEQYLNEGYQSRVAPMPPMPAGDPRPAIVTLLEAEKAIRNDENYQIDLGGVPTYWRDIMLLLRTYKNRKKYNEIVKLKGQIANPIYHIYLDKLLSKMKPPKEEQQQLQLTE